jgi:hypothetical protein
VALHGLKRQANNQTNYTVPKPMSINLEALKYSHEESWHTKFGCNVAAYFYQCSLDGDGETLSDIFDDGESIIHFEVSDDERKALSIEWQECFLYEDDLGFVTAQSFKG